MKFYLEENLEKLARWLRFLGYPAYTIKGEVNPSKIKPDGVFITTSRKWYEKLKKRGLNVFLVPRHDFEIQLCSVVKYFNLRKGLSLNLCAYCSSPLMNLGREEVKGKVPEGVYEEGEDFTLCPKCGAIFWKGSHYRKMKKKLEEILKKC
ncbi:Mut7-C RNAse domain-containing protein [Aquifex sp.]